MRLRNGYLDLDERQRIVKMWLNGSSGNAAARAVGCAPVHACHWINRYKAEGWAGLETKPKPVSSFGNNNTPEEVRERIVELRLANPNRPMTWIAEQVTPLRYPDSGRKVSVGTVSAILKKAEVFAL